MTTYQPSEKYNSSAKEFSVTLDSLNAIDERYVAGKQYKYKAAKLLWTDLIQRCTPSNYYVGTGEDVFDCKDDSSEKIDLVVYDSNYKKRMSWNANGERGYTMPSSKISAESICAVFDIHYEINECNLKHTEEKIKSILCLDKTNARRKIIGGVLSRHTSWREGLEAQEFYECIARHPALNFLVTTKNGFYESFSDSKGIIQSSEHSFSVSLSRIFTLLSLKTSLPK